MVRDEGHAVGRSGEILEFAAHVGAHAVRIHVPLGDFVRDVVELPGVARIEGAVVVVRLLGLGQHEHLRLDVLQRPAHTAPEGGRHLHRHVTTEAIDVVVPHPEGHRILHGGIESILLSALPIQLGHIDPIGARGRLDAAVFVEQVVTQTNGIAGPDRVEGRVVGDPVDDDLHAVVMGGSDEGIEVLPGSVIRVECFVVLNTVGAPEGTAARLHQVVVLVLPALPVHLADRMHRHEPDDVHAQLLDAGEVGSSAPKVTLGAVLPDIHFIDHGIPRPFRMDEYV